MPATALSVAALQAPLAALVIVAAPGVLIAILSVPAPMLMPALVAVPLIVFLIPQVFGLKLSGLRLTAPSVSYQTNSTIS